MGNGTLVEGHYALPNQVEGNHFDQALHFLEMRET